MMHFSDWGNMGGTTTESGGGAGNIFILIWGMRGGRNVIFVGEGGGGCRTREEVGLA